MGKGDTGYKPVPATDLLQSSDAAETLKLGESDGVKRHDVQPSEQLFGPVQLFLSTEKLRRVGCFEELVESSPKRLDFADNRCGDSRFSRFL